MLKSFQINKYSVTVCFVSQIGFEKPENQDSIFFDANSDSFGLSICDGLGSAALSAQGSAEAATIMVTQLLNGRFGKDSFKKEWLKRFPDSTQKYNTTAKFVFLGQGKIRLGGIGDGTIALKSGGKISEYTSRGDFANQTSCVFDLAYDANFVDKTILPKFPAAIMISTDGFSEDIKDDGLEILMNAAYESLQNPKTSEEFDDSLNELLKNWPNPTNGDDKTAAFILVEEKV